MKLPGVSGVYDYAGPSRNLRCRSHPYCLPPMQKRQRPDCIFSKLNTQPTCTPVYASPNTSRCATQNSGPSGSLLLSRRTLAFPASCRFIPAHCVGDYALFDECNHAHDSNQTGSPPRALHGLRLSSALGYQAHRRSVHELSELEPFTPTDRSYIAIFVHPIDSVSGMESFAQ